MKKQSLSVIVPVYESESTLTELVERINKVLSREISFEIIMVNDGSLDRSWEVVKKLCRTYPFIKVLKPDAKLRSA